MYNSHMFVICMEQNFATLMLFCLFKTLVLLKMDQLIFTDLWM